MICQLSAHRALLLARERHCALQRELQRVKTLHALRRATPTAASRIAPEGRFEVNAIAVQLNRNFYARNVNERMWDLFTHANPDSR